MPFDYEERNRERNRKSTARRDQLARHAAREALRRGEIVRGSCAVGTDCKGSLEMHHADHRQPLAVTWLCRRHHQQLHARERLALRKRRRIRVG